ncbi:MAG: hypothetical protein KA176_01295 [Alphaproteobacteria bacterium]|nr:hypothetical protein [Alphaproteobacteria bacterium]
MADFDFEIKNFDPKAVKSEDEAFAILLRFEPEPYKRYLSLILRNRDPSYNFTHEDGVFSRAYQDFLEDSYGEDARYNLNDAYQYAKELSAWVGDFTEYSQTLHDAGLIFKSEIYTELKKHGIEPAYSETSTARRYYQLRAGDGLWPLDTAVKLYLGYRRDGKKLFRVLDQRSPISVRALAYFEEKGVWYVDACNKAETLKEFVARHVNAGEIESVNGSFRPKEITKFLSQYFPDTYRLPVLFEVLGLNAQSEDQGSVNTEKKQPIKLIIEDLYRYALPFWKEYASKNNGREPTRGDTAKFLRKNHYNIWAAATIERHLSFAKLKENFHNYIRDTPK